MSLIVPAGQSVDFAEDPNITIKNLLSNNWPTGGASGDIELKKYDVTTVPEGVIISTDWWKGKTFYEIHVRPLVETISDRTLGKARWQYFDDHDVHMFARGNNGKDKLWKLEKEVKKILHLNEASPGTGISWMKLTAGPREVPEEDYRSDVYHSVMTVRLFYEKVKQ